MRFSLGYVDDCERKGGQQGRLGLLLPQRTTKGGWMGVLKVSSSTSVQIRIITNTTSSQWWLCLASSWKPPRMENSSAFLTATTMGSHGLSRIDHIGVGLRDTSHAAQWYWCPRLFFFSWLTPNTELHLNVQSWNPNDRAHASPRLELVPGGVPALVQALILTCLHGTGGSCHCWEAAAGGTASLLHLSPLCPSAALQRLGMVRGAHRGALGWEGGCCLPQGIRQVGQSCTWGKVCV